MPGVAANNSPGLLDRELLFGFDQDALAVAVDTGTRTHVGQT